MDQAEIDALVGRALRERRETQEQLAKLRNESSRYGQMFAALAELLKQRPFSVMFENRSANMKAGPSDGPVFKIEEVDGNRIIILVDQIRATMERLVHLEEQIRELGY